jgi:hypothetical protein
MPEFHGQHPTRKYYASSFLILCAEDVDPDKVLRRYHALDLEFKGFVEGIKVHSNSL